MEGEDLVRSRQTHTDKKGTSVPVFRESII